MLFIAVFLSIWTLSWFIFQTYSYFWPATEGKITWSALETREGESRTTYYMHIEYSYTVDGKEYTGTEVHVNEFRLSSAYPSIVNKTADYPLGATVKVYYNPLNPATACLKRGYSLDLLVIFIIAVISWTLVIYHYWKTSPQTIQKIFYKIVPGSGTLSRPMSSSPIEKYATEDQEQITLEQESGVSSEANSQ